MAVNALNRSFVEGKHPIAPWDPERGDTPYSPKSTMILCSPFPDVLMRSIAEWCVCWEFAVTEFVVAGFGYVERDRAAPCQNPFALSIAKRVDLTVATGAPVIHLAAVKEHMSWENTCVRWHTGWPILAFFVWSALFKQSNFLMRKIGDIVHRFDFSLLRWSQNFWIWKHHVSLVRLQFNSSWTINISIRTTFLLTPRWHSA